MKLVALTAAVSALILAGCATPEEGVVNKVMADFGLAERPEGYVSGTDRVFAQLPDVGATEMKRMNLEERHGEVKVQEDGLRVKYYKEVKRYEHATPLDAQPAPRTSHTDRAYTGFIEFEYVVYQSARKNSRPEAEAATADIPTDERGRETYRYRFTSGGFWDGAQGEPARR